MPASEVENPIINSPYKEPQAHWKIHEHEPAEKINGRSKPAYLYLPPGAKTDGGNDRDVGYEIELQTVSLIRQRLAEWRPLALRGEGGVSRVTMELLNYWRRDGRKEPLFFAQLEAAETIIFLTEARADFLQGIAIPLDEPGEEKQRDGFAAFRRRCCRMATGAGKTTVMAMLAAWSVLNKVNNKNDRRFSDAILIVCPNVTIRDRLMELDPKKGEASIYRTRDLIPQPMMPQLSQGRVLTINWHVFEPHTSQSANKVVKTGKRTLVRETIFIGDKNTTARGRRYITEGTLRQQHGMGLIEVIEEIRDKSGTLKRAMIKSEKYIETDAAILRRILDGELGTRRNILVFNDEAHHAYRLHTAGDDNGNDSDNEMLGDDEMTANYYKEATVWVDGLDRVHKLRGINFCADFSATPYFLGKAGDNTNRIFPWTVSNFGLQDAIESGLVKIPQLAAQDSSGKSVPGYFNIWKWILPQLTPTERGSKKSGAKPEAIVKYAHTPIAMLGGMWEKTRQEWAVSADPRPPVFILVCKTKKLAKVVYEWLADDKPPSATIPRAGLPELRNTEDKQNTICVYSDVQRDIESGNTKSDETRWMRHTLDTIGKIDWIRDSQQRPQYPDGFEDLSEKLGLEKHPPGRDVRCIVSVGMLTEGWDCSTVTHIIGLRPFMSQLLCEQVIGRGLRRASYHVGEDGLMHEEIATVLGVPLSSFTVKAGNGGKSEPRTLHHIYALSDKVKYEIHFPRVEGYRQSVRRRIICDMENIPSLPIDYANIPPEVKMKAGLLNNQGRPSLHGPGKINNASLQEFREQFRLQAEIYKMTTALTRDYAEDDKCELPVSVLFSQLYKIVHAYITEKVSATAPADKKDAFLAPYYGWVIENLRQNIHPDPSAGEAPELPRYERSRGSGSTADVDFFTRREPYPVQKSHINAVVPGTKRLEQLTTYHLDDHPQVIAFAKNEGMGFGIPYLHNGEPHDYMPDFLICLHKEKQHYLILETKGYDPLKDVKKSAAMRWVNAVNADDAHGQWQYRMVSKVDEVDNAINEAVAEICSGVSHP
ncbi:BPTD_3080 family restriction endonuclease [Candidatus Spongiihabitans sp.]|uniref:BPTD_3080 family restriction endonuclease n=1 Tax=Candidatus Spongiihabitans sp. TaxID=3101308 RepID=UPI003C7B5C6B